jgi:hypothetical protein
MTTRLYSRRNILLICVMLDLERDLLVRGLRELPREGEAGAT